MQFNVFAYDGLVGDLLLGDLTGITDKEILEKYTHLFTTVEDVAIVRKELEEDLDIDNF